MLEDGRQLLYIRCRYVYPTGLQCSNPVVQYLEAQLCGGHCDNIELPPVAEHWEDSVGGQSDEIELPPETKGVQVEMAEMKCICMAP